MFRLDGKVIAVVGAASGIGEAIAKVAAAQGGNVVALDVDDVGLERVCGEIEKKRGKATFRHLDICNRDDVEATFRSRTSPSGTTRTRKRAFSNGGRGRKRWQARRCFSCRMASYVTGTVLFVDGGWTAADGRFTPP